jgi:hypothetical protein
VTTIQLDGSVVTTVEADLLADADTLDAHAGKVRDRLDTLRRFERTLRSAPKVLAGLVFAGALWQMGGILSLETPWPSIKALAAIAGAPVVTALAVRAGLALVLRRLRPRFGAPSG